MKKVIIMDEDFDNLDNCSDEYIKQYLDECEADRILSSLECMDTYNL